MIIGIKSGKRNKLICFDKLDWIKGSNSNIEDNFSIILYLPPTTNDDK